MKDKEYINPPNACDICQRKIKDKFYDGKTLIGPWANMCPSCYSEYGHSPDLVIGYIKKENRFFATK